MIRIPSLPLTREHGSWALLAVPLAIGSASAETVSVRHAVLALAALAAFLSHVPLQALLDHATDRAPSDATMRGARFWVVILIGVALTFGVGLVVLGELHLLAWGTVAATSLVIRSVMNRSNGRSAGADLVAVAGLSVGAPSALLLGATDDWSRAILLWILVALFFGCSVVYVHMKMHRTAFRSMDLPLRRRLRLGWMPLTYHVFVIVLAAVIVQMGATSYMTVLAYLPMAIHALIGTIRLSAPVRFRRLGFLLVGQSVIFAVLLTGAWRGMV